MASQIAEQGSIWANLEKPQGDFILWRNLTPIIRSYLLLIVSRLIPNLMGEYCRIKGCNGVYSVRCRGCRQFYCETHFSEHVKTCRFK